jgi:RNase P subunit RPR2
MELVFMPYDKELKIQAEKILRDAAWTCQECGGNMPLEYEEDNDDEVGYRIISATCEGCGMINDSTINNEFGQKLDECSTRELLGI